LGGKEGGDLRLWLVRQGGGDEGAWHGEPYNSNRGGDIFITLSGEIDVLDSAHFSSMKDGAIVANS